MPAQSIAEFEAQMKARRLFRRKEYTHKQFENEIPEFLEDRLTNRALERFLQHMDSCDACRDELSTQYLVDRGLPRLETGETFNLGKELGSYVALERKRLRKRVQLGKTAYLLEIVTLLAALAAIIGIFLLELL